MLVRKEELLILQELQAKCQHLASRLELMLVKVLKLSDDCSCLEPSLGI